MGAPLFRKCPEIGEKRLGHGDVVKRQPAGTGGVSITRRGVRTTTHSVVGSWGRRYRSPQSWEKGSERGVNRSKGLSLLRPRLEERENKPSTAKEKSKRKHST